jgi:hypothetical protein
VPVPIAACAEPGCAILVLSGERSIAFDASVPRQALRVLRRNERAASRGPLLGRRCAEILHSVHLHLQDDTRAWTLHSARPTPEPALAGVDVELRVPRIPAAVSDDAVNQAAVLRGAGLARLLERVVFVL